MAESEAVALVKDQLSKQGYADKVSWNGSIFSASVGPFGALVKINGTINAHDAILDKCGGVAGGVVRSKIRGILLNLFPDGEVC